MSVVVLQVNINTLHKPINSITTQSVCERPCPHTSKVG